MSHDPPRVRRALGGGVSKTPEGRVLKACLDFLAANGIFAVRVNVQGVPIHGQPGKFRPAPSRGIADIIGIARGEVMKCDFEAVPLAVEVKSATGRQSPAQRAFQQKWEAAGGVYILCRSVGDLSKGLREAGVSLRTR